MSDTSENKFPPGTTFVMCLLFGFIMIAVWNVFLFIVFPLRLIFSYQPFTLMNSALWQLMTVIFLMGTFDSSGVMGHYTFKENPIFPIITWAFILFVLFCESLVRRAARDEYVEA